MGKTITIKEKHAPSNVTVKPAWSSSNPKVAMVSSKGKITAVALGTAKITCKFGNKSASCVITVNSNSNNVQVFVGESKSVKNSFKTVSGYTGAKYASSNTKIATVNQSGVVTGKSRGVVFITATVNGVKYSQRVAIKKPSITLNKTAANLYSGLTHPVSVGAAVQLQATTDPAGKTVTWTSSNPKVATVSATGKVTAIAPGTATIKASFKYYGKVYSKVCKVTVKKVASILIKNVDWDTNSAGGVEPKITFVNTTKKDIKYIDFIVRFYNAVGDMVYNEIGYYDHANLNVTGPFRAGNTRVYYWDPVFYYNGVHALRIQNVVVTYMDGTKENISYNKLWYDKYYYYQ